MYKQGDIVTLKPGLTLRIPRYKPGDSLELLDRLVKQPTVWRVRHIECSEDLNSCWVASEEDFDEFRSLVMSAIKSY